MSEETLSQQQRLDRGLRAATLLEDQAAQDALHLMGHEFYQRFKQSVTDEDRRNAWALATSLDVFADVLHVMAEDGDIARAEIIAADKRAQSSPTPSR